MFTTGENLLLFLSLKTWLDIVFENFLPLEFSKDMDLRRLLKPHQAERPRQQQPNKVKEIYAICKSVN